MVGNGVPGGEIFLRKLQTQLQWRYPSMKTGRPSGDLGSFRKEWHDGKALFCGCQMLSGRHVVKNPKWCTMMLWFVLHDMRLHQDDITLLVGVWDLLCRKPNTSRCKWSFLCKWRSIDMSTEEARWNLQNSWVSESGSVLQLEMFRFKLYEFCEGFWLLDSWWFPRFLAPQTWREDVVDIFLDGWLSPWFKEEICHTCTGWPWIWILYGIMELSYQLI